MANGSGYESMLIAARCWAVCACGLPPPPKEVTIVRSPLDIESGGGGDEEDELAAARRRLELRRQQSMDRKQRKVRKKRSPA